MSSHVELNPDDSTLGLSLGMKAMRLALTQETHRIGTVRIPTQGDTDVIIGDGASDGVNRIDQDGRQLPLVDTSGIDKAAKDAQQKADAAAAKADKVRSDLTRQVQDAKSEMDSTVKAAQSSADKAQSAADAAQKAADKANASTADLDKSIKAVDAKVIAAKQAAAEAQSKAENVASDLDSANAVIEQHTTELGTLTTKVSNAVTKSDSALSVSTEAKQTATEASTTASSAYKDSQTALTQSTTATQTATAAKTTAESAGKTANDSLKQSSAAVQTANQISTTLKTEYQTKADADKIYATQSSLKQTSDSITTSVSKTYATKDALSALQNVADNAIESWRGTGVPTLTNKPASDWTTDAKRKKHSGDLYYDKATGKAYRFGSDDGETYTWELNQDTDVTKALADAAKAQTSANNAQASATAANTAAGKAQSTANTAVGNAATAKNAADAAQSSANKAQGDVDKLKIDIPATYATKSSLSQTAESITANVESVKTTANSAVTAASKAQQTADAVTLNLSKNYNTKAQNDALYATQTSLKATSDSLSANITANAKTAQSAVDKATSLEANLNGFKTTVAETYQTKDGMSDYATTSALNQTADSIKAEVTEVSKTANSAMSKATTVEQTASGLSTKITEQGKTLNATVTTANEAKSTADSNKTTISQISTAASDALSKASTVEQNLSGFKTTVSQTYTTKNDFNNLTIGGRNLLLNSNFSKGTDNWVLELQNNGLGTVKAEALSGFAFATTMLTINVTKSTTNLCRIYQLRSPNPMRTDTVDTVSFWATASESVPVQFGRNDDQRFITVQKGWHYYKATVSKWNGSNAFVIGFKNGFVGTLKITNIMWEHASKASQWSPAPEDLQPAGDYSTKSYVDQTAKSVALGVVQNYKGSDGSGLATKSDITVAKDSITSTVASTYATKSGVTQEISSKITQNNNSLDVKFATKSENQTAQDTANAAKSDASKAQSRVGALESCISLTSDGVQVGKRSNGEFTGPSALVGTDGVFHVKNRDSNGKTDDVVKLGQDVLVVKSKLAQSGGGYIDRLMVGPYGDDHFAIRLSPALAADASNSSEPVQMWQTGWQNVTTGKGCEVYGHASYGYRGGCLRFRGRVKTTIDGDNSLFDNPGVLKLWVSTMNRNFLLPAYRDNALGWANAYIPANSRQVKIHGVWDWVSLDQLSIAQ